MTQRNMITDAGRAACRAVQAAAAAEKTARTHGMIIAALARKIVTGATAAWVRWATGLSKSTVIRCMRVLVTNGRVERLDDPCDSRVKRYRLVTA